VAALIKQDTGIDPDVIEGTRGEFSIWVGDARVAQKEAHRFPSEEDVVARVSEALGRQKREVRSEK
jgi:hypothetical protein